MHKPGVVALRPLGLGDLYDGAFKTIRRNPKAMVGLSALVSTAFLVIPVLVTLGVAALGQLSLDLGSEMTADDPAAVIGLAAPYLLASLGSLFGVFATIVLNGMLVFVVAEAVLGRRTSIAQAWAGVRGRLLRLVGLTFLGVLVALVLVGIAAGLGVLTGFTVGVGAGFAVGIPLTVLAVVALVYLQVRYFLLAAPALVLERTGVFAALGRAGRLSRAQWWRLFGIYLLTGLITGVAGQVLSVPLGLAGGIGPALLPGTGGALILVFSGYLTQILVAALTTPFTSAVTALQYVDQRIRKEALDVELIAASQRSAPGLA